ncbi:carboxypeptidase-like regulatory domain-containing protein [Phaeospirillum tilakii]|uniref:Carboxypeptidase-like regulatory domain-containing protein n=1 Tax=Phaeospirillum tilakii TaxID=741673 RepID=A0ABW5C504_9PROT
MSGAAAPHPAWGDAPNPLFSENKGGPGHRPGRVRAAARSLALAVLLLAAGPAEAHKLKLFVTQAGTDIEGEAFFVGGGRPQGASVIIHDPAGQEVARLATDAEGRFRWTPPRPDAYRIAVDCGDGHAIETSLGAAPVAVPVAAGPAPEEARIEAAVERVLARRLDPLIAAQIEADSRLRLNDLVGGIGYIVGLAGLGLAWAARRRR